LRVALEVEIPSDVRHIERVVALVQQSCADLDLPPRQLAFNVPVALTEALSNAILYGNHERVDAQVRVRAVVEERTLVFEVTDDGDGFDLEACTLDPTSDDNLLREDGRGLFLMRRLMDRVERFTKQGNVVRLTLNRP
jgi:serine/threonine-protein kinase RsbW